MPQVSVVIPLYNKADHIGRALDSVFEQGVDDLEVIVVDDGSTDDGPSIVEGYGDARIRLIRQANAGPGAARNRGIREATAEWIAPLDADDCWLPGFLGYMTEHAAAHPDCDAVTCFWYTDPEAKDAFARRFLDRGDPVGPYRLVTDADPRLMRSLMARFGCRNTMARRSVILDVGGFYEASRHGEDLYLWLKLLLTCRIYLGDAVLAFHDLGASELSIGARRQGNVPMPRPFVSDPDPIRAVCPPEYREQLETLITALARREAWHQIQAGRVGVARDLIAQYPKVGARRMDGMRFAFWMRIGRAHEGRPIGEWGWFPRFVFRRCKWMRLKTKSI